MSVFDNTVPKRWIVIGLLSAAMFASVLVGWQGVSAWMSWSNVERVPFDLDAARSALTVPETAATDTPTTTLSVTTTTMPPVEYTTVLVIGSDARPEGQREDDYAFADAILLYLVPKNGDDPAVVSIPRDTRVIDPCTGEESKVNRTLEPCGDAISGPEHVSLTVEDLTGIPVDHYALLRFDALVEIVDAVGGVEICVEYAQREGGYDLLPAGCSTVDGEHALAWVRSRTTQVMVDDQWQFASELGDEARVNRRPVLLFALLAKLKDVRSPADLVGLADQFGDTVVLSGTFGIGDVAGMAWDLRSRSTSAIRTFTVPTEPDALPDGSYAVRMSTPLRQLLEKGGE